MITVKRATKKDLPAIRFLMQKYGNKMLVCEWHINNKDIALQARHDDGTLVGFVFGGLMANNKVCYVDKIAIDPEYRKQGIANKLYQELFKVALNRGVVQAFGVIKQDEYHDASCVNALKMAFGADNKPYTYVQGNLAYMKAELEASNGR